MTITRIVRDPKSLDVMFVDVWRSEKDFEFYMSWRESRGDMEIVNDSAVGPPTIEVWRDLVVREVLADAA